MSSSPVIGVFLALTGVVASTSADANWSGTNSYFIYSIPNPDRGTMLDAIAGAGYKVIRVFITSTGARSKGTNSTGVHDLEPGTVGVYYDSILTQIDQLMVDCIQRRLKLIIAMHDRYMLGWSGSDAYVYKYHLPTGSHNNATAFYFDSRAQSDFDRRLLHILNHQNALLGNRSWSALSEAVFAFEPENESQGYLSVPNPSWLCDRAAVIRQALGPGNPILVSTGGGVAFSDSNSKSYFQCPSIDIVAVHDYTRQTASGLNQSLALARQYGKRIILEEFGATGTNKATSLGTQSSAAMSLGIPWIVWESLNPGAGAADYEFWTNEPGWQTLSTNAIKSLTLNSSFTWPELYSGHASTTPANRRVQPTTARQKRTTTKVHRMTTKVQKMTTKVHRMTTKVHRMTTKVQMMTTKVHRMTTKVHRMTTKVQKMTTKAQRMTSKVHRMTTKRMTTKVHRMTTKVQRMTTPEDNLRGKLMTTTVQNRNTSKNGSRPQVAFSRIAYSSTYRVPPSISHRQRQPPGTTSAKTMQRLPITISLLRPRTSNLRNPAANVASGSRTAHHTITDKQAYTSRREQGRTARSSTNPKASNRRGKRPSSHQTTVKNDLAAEIGVRVSSASRRPILRTSNAGRPLFKIQVRSTSRKVDQNQSSGPEARISWSVMTNNAISWASTNVKVLTAGATVSTIAIVVVLWLRRSRLRRRANENVAFLQSIFTNEYDRGVGL